MDENSTHAIMATVFAGGILGVAKFIVILVDRKFRDLDVKLLELARDLEHTDSQQSGEIKGVHERLATIGSMIAVLQEWRGSADRELTGLRERYHNWAAGKRE